MQSERYYDAVVCGGGIAGIAAALASARNGAKTCIIEKEYCLGGLATLGLIVIYLPLCDGTGIQMSGGICEELLKNSVKYGTGEIPAPWKNPSEHSLEELKDKRYMVTYNAASFIISAEQLLLNEGIKLYYDARITDVIHNNGKINSAVINTKVNNLIIHGKAFIDATGDADICYLSGEETIDDNDNRRTGWYYSYDGNNLKLNPLTDPLYGEIPDDSRTYSGTDIDDISDHMIAMRKFILNDIIIKRNNGNHNIYPLIIPSFHGFRMTRRLSGTLEFSEDKHNYVWFDDAIGMIGNWKCTDKRYSIPYRCIKGVKNNNLYVAGRCVCADKSGWDLTRVIPTCAITGEAAGTAAAMQAAANQTPNINDLQNLLVKNNVLLNKALFNEVLS